MEDRTGRWLAGRYRLDRRIATERTGDRYEAWDGAALLGVVVWTLAPALTEPSDALSRYEGLTTQMRALGHRGMIAVRGIDRDGETLFLVLDAPPGPSLRTLLQERDTPFTIAEATRLLGPVADALDALHAVGAIHRHVAPETIFVTPDGGALLAEPLYAPPGMDGALFGPSACLSPEQARGDALTGAADIYALGAVLAEMLTLTGHPTDTGTPLVRRVTRTLARALSPDPAHRQGTARTLIAEIGGDEREPMGATTALPRGATADDTVAHHLPVAPARRPAPTVVPTAYDESDATEYLPDDDAARGPRARSLPPALVMLTALVLLGALVLGTLVVKRNQTLTTQQGHYATAETALGQGDYDTAISEFGAAGTYRDAPTRAQAAATTKQQQDNYDAGTAALGQQDYAAAADAFGNAGTFRDAPQRRADALRLGDQQQAYMDGQSALAKEDYPAAATDFARAGTYLDAPRLATQAQSLIGQQQQYQAGLDASGREDYATAAAAFRSAGAYKDAPQRATQAEKLRGQKVAYDAGAAAFAREDYKGAKQQFDAAGDFKDAQARAAQASQEDQLLTKYTSAQTHLQTSQWKEAYAELQEINKVRPDYKDVRAVINHLENDVANPTVVDLSAALNQGNGYKEAWVAVNNLIGQPVTWLYVASRQTADSARPEQVSAISVALVATQGGKEALNTDLPVLAANSDLRDKNALRPGEAFSVVTDKGQTIEVAGFGKYRARLTVTNLAFPQKISGNDSAGTINTFFSRLAIEVTLAPKAA
ncbi:MAG: serine/threonine protein kinase [Thermomicrobiales bacterium]